MNVFTRLLPGAAATLVTAALLAGCGGGATSTATPPVSTGGGTAPMSITVTLPGRSTTTATGKRIPLYTSIDTKGIGIEYHAQPAGYSGAPSSSPTFAAQVGAGVSNRVVTCTSAGSNGSYSCTFYIPAVPVGYDDFRVALWNVAPSACTVSGSSCNFNSGKVLSFNTVTDQAIIGGVSNHGGVDGATPPPNSVNNLGFTLDPVVDSVTVTLGNAQIVDGTPSSTTASVSAKDAAGNVILTSGSDTYVDASGNPLTISLSILNNCGSSLSFTPASPLFASATAPNTATVSYDGLTNCPTSGSLPTVHTTVSTPIAGTSFDGAFSVTSSNATASIPGVPQVSASETTSAQPRLMASDSSDGYLYVVTNGIERFNPQGALGSTAAVATSSSNILGIAYGPDGDIWYTDNANAAVVHQNEGTAGANRVSKTGGFGNLGFITAGPDNNMWFIDSTNGNLNRINPAGSAASETVTTYSSGSVNWSTTSIAAGTFSNGDKAVCGGSWTNGGSEYILCRDITESSTLTVNVGTAGNHVYSMAFGPDGLLYAGTVNSAITSYYAVSGAPPSIVTNHSYAIAAGTALSLVSGPDGNMWFVVGSDANNVIGAISLKQISGTPPFTAGTLSEWGGYSAVGASGSPLFNQLVVGSDHNLWVSDTSADNKLDRLGL